MSNRTYPRLGDWRAPKVNSTRACTIDQIVPAGQQDVQVSYMRGDDEVVAICGGCRSRPDLLERIIAIWKKS